MGKKKEELRNNWKFWALIILAVIVFFGFSDNEDYQRCVDDCVWENDYCLETSTFYSSNSVEYILYYNVLDCQYDLEDCVTECGR